MQSQNGNRIKKWLIIAVSFSLMVGIWSNGQTSVTAFSQEDTADDENGNENKNENVDGDILEMPGQESEPEETALDVVELIDEDATEFSEESEKEPAISDEETSSPEEIDADSPDEKDLEPDSASSDMESAEDPEDDTILLQIPQKLDIFVDPWELSGKGQIYSSKYSIRNAGETAGELELTGIVQVMREGEKITVNETGANVHDGEDKAVYIAAVFANGDRFVLSQEGETYSVRLQPNEKITFAFSGEVNENAIKEWKNGDFDIELDYAWIY